MKERIEEDVKVMRTQTPLYAVADHGLGRRGIEGG